MNEALISCNLIIGIIEKLLDRIEKLEFKVKELEEKSIEDLHDD